MGGINAAPATASGESMSLRDHIGAQSLSSNRRFESHRTWVFFVFDLAQRKDVLQRSSVRLKRPSVRTHSRILSDITAQHLLDLKATMEQGRPIDERSAVGILWKSCQWISGSVVGSQQARLNSRKDIKANLIAFGELPLIQKERLNMSPGSQMSNVTVLGQPGIWGTVNPSDTGSLLFLRFAGEDVNLDQLATEPLPTSKVRGRLVADHPVAAARSYWRVMEHFFKTLVRPSADGSEKGLFGRARATYGTMETQGRGSLHCHFLVWLHNMPKFEDLQEVLPAPDMEELRQTMARHLEMMIQQDTEERQWCGEPVREGGLVERSLDPISLQVPIDPNKDDDDYEYQMFEDWRLVRRTAQTLGRRCLRLTSAVDFRRLQPRTSCTTVRSPKGNAHLNDANTAFQETLSSIHCSMKTAPSRCAAEARTRRDTTNFSLACFDAITTWHHCLAVKTCWHGCTT